MASNLTTREERAKILGGASEFVEPPNAADMMRRLCRHVDVLEERLMEAEIRCDRIVRSAIEDVYYGMTDDPKPHALQRWQREALATARELEDNRDANAR